MGGMKVEICMKRWKSIRDHFVREVRKTKKPSGEAGPEFKSSWHLFGINWQERHLEFYER